MQPEAGESTGWLRLVMDSMNEGFGLLGPDFTILELNSQAMRIDPRDRNDVIGRLHWDAYPGTEHDEVGKLYKQAMAQRIAVEIEHRYDWPDGRVSWFETRAFPVENGCLAMFFRDVTERHLARDRVETSERRFKAAIAAIDGVLWTNSAQGEMVGVQEGWASLTGQSLAEYEGYGWSSAVHPDDAQPTIDAWEQAVATKAPFVFEHRVRNRDGEWRLCAVKAVPVLDVDGSVIEWVGIHRDITETRAEALRLHHMAETIDAVFYIHEIDNQRITYVSRAYERIWGQSRDALYADAHNFLRSVHPGDRPRLDESLHRQTLGICAPIEYRLILDDGTERIILDRPFDAIDPVSGTRTVVGLASDVTEYRKTQELLARNAETFANLVVSSPFGIYVIDAALRLVQVSRGAQAVFAGIDPLIGRGLDEILRILWAEPFASETIAACRNTLVTGEPFVSLSTEQRANIDEVEAYDWRIERITLPDGQYGVVCYFYDLSERKAYEDKLTQALADKDLLAREIDHRVKNSLTVVGSLLSMQRNGSTSRQTRAALEEAAARVIAVARVHERLHKSDTLGMVAFGDYLTDLCHDLASSLRGEDVELDCRTVPVELPAQNALSLALIANELVTNAFKHGCAAGATKISVELASAGKVLTLAIADNGADFPATAGGPSSSLGLKMVNALARQLKARSSMPCAGMPAAYLITVTLDQFARSDGQTGHGETSAG